MSGWRLDDAEHDEILRQSILPLVFPDIAAADTSPNLILLTGQPGAARMRAVNGIITEVDHDLAVLSADELHAFHPRARELTSTRPAAAVDATEGITRAATGWLRDCIRYARENGRSLLLEGSFQDPAVTVGTTQRFAAAGFQTRVVVVASRRAESLLSVASLYLSNVHAGKLARLVSRETHDRGFEATRALAAEIANSASVGRLTVIGRDGDPVFDAHRADGDAALVGGVAALETEQSARLNRFDATQWLSELHHMTDFAMTRQDLPRGVTELLLELHDVALREVVPELHVPSDSKFISAIEQKTAERLSELEQLPPREEIVDLAAPVATPVGPERGGISR